MIASIFEIIRTALTVILRWFDRHSFSKIDPKITEALKIREEISAQTNSMQLKLQKRDMEAFRKDLDRLSDKVDTILWMHQTNTPA